MARVLVLSRNAAIAMGLATADLDVMDQRPDATDRWLGAAADVDVVVMQPDSTFDAATAVYKLRRSASTARTLLIAPQNAPWPGPEEAERLSVERLDLPITLPSLLSEVNRLATLPALDEAATRRWSAEAPPTEAPPTEAPSEEPQPSNPPTPEDTEPWIEDDGEDEYADEQGPVGEDAADDERPAPDQPEADEGPDYTGDKDRRAVSREPAPAEGPDPLTAPLETLVVGSPSQWLYGQWSPSDYAPPADEPSPPAVVEQEQEPTERSPVSPVPRVATGQSVAELDLDILVAELLARRSQLTDLAEIGEIVVAECAARTGSSAGAFMCLDDEVWRVVAGVGLRPLEHRLQLESTHWLVHTLREEQKAVIIEDSDVSRDNLHGAPLASWEQIVAAPISDLDAFVLLGRHEDAYGAPAIEALLAVAAEARSMLRDAIAVRALARALAPLIDPVD